MNTQIVSAVREHRIIAILRKVPVDRVTQTATALYEGGIRMLEITFDQSSGTRLRDTAQAIRDIDRAFGSKLLIGAGTVLTVEEVHAAADAGAKYVLAPDMNPAVISAAIGRGIAAIPGAMTPSEIAQAHEHGAAMVKLFPAGSLGTGYLRAIRAPLSHIELLAVGGIDHLNIRDYLAAGAIGAGIGSSIADNKLIAQGHYGELTALALKYTGALTQSEGKI